MAALTVSLEQLDADARRYADARPGGASEFVTTTDSYRLINQKIREHQDLLISLRPQDQLIIKYTDASFVTAGTADYDIPDDATPPYHSAVSLILLWTPSTPEVVPWIPVSEIHKYMGLTWGQGTPKGYTLGEDEPRIIFYPTPATSVVGQFRYIPAHVDLVASPGSPNTIATINGWDKLISLGVAIEMLAIAGRDPRHLAKLYQDQVERLEKLASERHTTEAKEVREVYPEGFGYGRGRDWTQRWTPP